MRSHPRFGLPSTRITSATTTTVKATTGMVHRIVIEVALAGIVTFNDNDGAVLILPVAIPAGSYELNLAFNGKIEVVTAGADRLVVAYE